MFMKHDQDYYQGLFIAFYKVFLVAGGYNDNVQAGYISSTETLVEGGQAWNFQKPLPTGRQGLVGISLLDTVIMTGKYIFTFVLKTHLSDIYFYETFSNCQHETFDVFFVFIFVAQEGNRKIK